MDGAFEDRGRHRASGVGLELVIKLLLHYLISVRLFYLLWASSTDFCSSNFAHFCIYEQDDVLDLVKAYLPSYKVFELFP